MNSLFFHNADKSRYELTENGHVLYADYARMQDILTIKYVYAPPELRGTGAAGRFMEMLMQTAQTERLKVIPQCGYAASWIHRHPHYQSLLA